MNFLYRFSEFFNELPDRISARRALGLTESRPVLLTVARLVPRKGVDGVLNVLPDLIKSFPGLTYLVVGEGTEKSRLKQLAFEKGLLMNQVRFEGFVPQNRLPLYYAASDLFVLVSSTTSHDVEGFGIVYLEAQAAGLPIVAASGGGAPDAILNKETGILVPEDDPEVLRQTIAELLEDNGKRAEMSRRARTWVRENFHPSKQAADFWKLLDEIFDEKASLK